MSSALENDVNAEDLAILEVVRRANIPLGPIRHSVRGSVQFLLRQMHGKEGTVLTAEERAAIGTVENASDRTERALGYLDRMHGGSVQLGNLRPDELEALDCVLVQHMSGVTALDALINAALESESIPNRHRQTARLKELLLQG